jgi:hypothetical protein
MRYLNSSELSIFHNSLVNMFKKQAVSASQRKWGFPSGAITCDTYLFNTDRGALYIGHDYFIKEKRWWIPICLGDQFERNELQIAFEMNIPKTSNMYLSVHYIIDDTNFVHILHKGKVTVGHSSMSMDDFFNYYQRSPGRWPVINLFGHTYLELGKVSLTIADNEFHDLLESLSGFARYITQFKNTYR